MPRLHPRLVAHTLVVGLLLSVTVPEAVMVGVASVKANVATPTPEPRLLVLDPKDDSRVVVSRSTLSERTPLPTPFPIPPGATPLAAPPEPTPVPTPVPVVAFWPAPGGYVSQYFSGGHPALDIAAPCGNSVLAVWSGSVVFAGWKDNGGGYVVDIQFDNGLVGSYNHLSAIYVGGGWVPAGTHLGAVGATGLATGCHLHLTLSDGHQFFNPLAYVWP